MKKWIYLGLAALSVTTLTGCENITRAIRGNEYVDSKLASSASQASSNQQSKELQKALKADKSAFPQLSEIVADNEAQAILHTSAGDITVKLFPKYAPLAVENFLTHAKDGYYNGLTFHRVIKDFMVQTGDPNGDGTGGESIWNGKDSTIDSGSGFKNETTPYLYNIRGSLAMANAGADTNGSQFYINQNGQDQSSNLTTDTYPQAIIDAYKKGGNPSLDGGYTVFGQVISGMDVVDKIASAETDTNDKPKNDITIKNIEIIKDYDFEQ